MRDKDKVILETVGRILTNKEDNEEFRIDITVYGNKMANIECYALDKDEPKAVDEGFKEKCVSKDDVVESLKTTFDSILKALV